MWERKMPLPNPDVGLGEKDEHTCTPPTSPAHYEPPTPPITQGTHQVVLPLVTFHSLSHFVLKNE
eukprot:UN20684